MKKTRKIIFLVFIAIAVIGMFLPIATFYDDSSASIAADIEKQQGKVDSAQTQLDRWIAGGKKSDAEIQKQRDKVAKEQAKLDDLKAQGFDVDDFDALTPALEAGSAKAVNIVLMGHFAAKSGIGKDRWLAALEKTVPAKFLEMNRRAFELGYSA